VPVLVQTNWLSTGGVAFVPFFVYNSIQIKRVVQQMPIESVNLIRACFTTRLHKLVFCLLILSPIRDILCSQVECMILNKIHLSEIKLVSYIVTIVYCVESRST